jgi:hypothetical protein
MVVPFVDTLTTNLDHSLPLTTGEFNEFGNAKENKEHFDYEEIRLVGFVNANQYDFKWCYDGKIVNGNSGELWYFNANKRHSVFSTKDGVMLLVICLSFDKELFLKLTRSSLVK